MGNAGTGGQMVTPPDETTADPYAVIAALRAERDAALAREAATAEVLQVIKSSRGDLTPVFDAILERAHSLCGAFLGGLWTYNGERFRAVATRGYPEYLVEMIRRPIRGTVFHQRLVRGERYVHVLDVLAEVSALNDPVVKASTEAGNRTFLAVPLRKDGTLMGHISAARSEVRPFSDQEIGLLENFASQAVIAMENARLLTETREALDQQTATAEVLQVINSSPGDPAPVFDAMLEKAMRLCQATGGALRSFDGDAFHAVAMRGMPTAFLEATRTLRTTPHSGLGRIERGERVVQISDFTDTSHPRAGAQGWRLVSELGGARTSLWVALRKEATLLGTFVLYRNEVRSFSDKEVGLVENFAAQAVIAMENARLLGELRQRTADLQEALEFQTATSDVLKVISGSDFELDPVFQAVVTTAARLCLADQATIYRHEDGEYRWAAGTSMPAEYERIERSFRTGPGPGSLVGRVALEKGTVQILDAWNDPLYSLKDDARVGGVRTILGVPLLRDGEPIGVIGVGRCRVEPFTERQIDLVRTFADQAVIAIENTRLLTEQREALEQQTATAEVLQVINASPGNVAPVFDAILEKAHTLCDAPLGSLVLCDGEQLRAVATRGYPREYETMVRQGFSPIPPFRQLASGEPFVHVPDTAAWPAAPNERDALVWRAASEIANIRAALFVPLRRDTTILGYISAQRQEKRPFTDKQIALLENFATQAVIAMENARLLTEQREALEQQTAVAEVLQVINASPGNLQPVFDAIISKAVHLCQAEFGGFLKFDGEAFRILTGASSVREPELLRPEPGTALAQLLGGAAFVHIADVADDDAYRARSPARVRLVEGFGARTTLFVGLRKDNVLLGTLTIFRREVREFTERQISLVQSFAAHAVIAMENARLLDEIRQRQEELRITFENMGDGVAMFDGTQHLVAWNRNFQEILDLPDALFKQHRTYEEHLHFLAARGDFGPGVDTVEQISQLVASTGHPYGYERTRPDGRVIEIRRNPVPDGGFMLLYSDITERKRSEEEIRAARDAAETALRDLKAAQANLIQAEKMASLGQLTAGIAHEIKNPLNFVNNFAELSGDLLDELHDAVATSQQAEIDELTATLKGNLAKIAEHGRRADGIVRSMLEHSRGSSGERRSVDLNTLVDEALNLAYHGARAQDQGFNITLHRDFDAGVTPVTLVPQDITRVLLNLFSNAFYAARRRQSMEVTPGFEPTLKVVTRELGDAVEIRVRDNGIGIPEEVRDKLFQPFFTTKPTGEGTGLGLSISYDIVKQQHGGSITVESKVGEFSEFTIRLPRSS
jgi:GAF domain-containing protein/nitrogen-specific signal transduction histidine kinase